MAETVEYVYDPNTKTYVTSRPMQAVGPRVIQKSNFIPSFTAAEIASLNLNVTKRDGKYIVKVPRQKALEKEFAKQERQQRERNKAVRVDPVSLQPLTRDTAITTDMSTPFVTLKGREITANQETGLVIPIKKANERDKDVPAPGFYVPSRNPNTGITEMTLVDADNWRYNLTREFLDNPEQVKQYKQLMADAGFWDGEIDTRDTPQFWAKLQAVTAETSIDNFFRYQATEGEAEGRTIDEYLTAMAAEGGAGGTETSTTISLSTEDELYAGLNQQFERYVGKRVPDNLLQEFVQRVNALERQSPQVRTTTGDNTTFTGGPGGIAEREAVQFAREQKGAGAFRGATYYLDALMDYVNRDTSGF